MAFDRFAKIAGALALAVTLTACNETSFPAADQAPAYGPVELIVLDASTAPLFEAPALGFVPATAATGTHLAEHGGRYRVGTGDLLRVTVWEYPELTDPQGEGGGLVVMQDGRIYFPYVGYIQAAGRTPGQIRDQLAAGLAAFLPEPQVDVRVVDFMSQNVVVTGAVATPGTVPLTDTGLSLLEAILVSGGATGGADLSRVLLDRDGQLYTLDLSGPERGLPLGANPALRDGDIVSVPQREQSRAYLFGEAGRVGEIDMTDREMTLTRALALAGGLDQRRADVNGVFLFRQIGGVTRVGQLDLSSPQGYLVGERTDVAPGDVIYITTAPVTRWNDLISQLLPSVQGPAALIGTVGGLTDE